MSWDKTALLQGQTSLWRYVDVARFLALIDRKELYFSRLHEFDDPWEGAWAPSDPLFDKHHDTEYMHYGATAFTTLPLVSCWHENETESVAMWKLYLSGREGVAIKTSVSSLIELFGPGRELRLGRVAYKPIDDFAFDPEVYVFDDGFRKGKTELLPIERNIFRKNTGYAHEQEVRLIIYDTHSPGQSIFSGDYLHDIQSLAAGLKTELPPGISVPVDISVLIHKIVVSPAFPKWAIASLQKAVNAAFAPSQPVVIEPSVLLDKPIIGKPSAASAR
jgi:hypothetical protein